MSCSIFITAALALAVTLPAISAQAQAPRTFVSAAGNDSNPCSFAAPCRHFQAAVNATGAGGEVDALDPAGYGPIVISQAITIEGQGWSYVAPPANGNAITITAGSGDKISIHGVSLNGVGIAGGTGIVFSSGAELQVVDCVVRNFTGRGIEFSPSAPSSLSVSNTLVADNGGRGIIVVPGGAGIFKAVLNGVQAHNNAIAGITVNGGAANSLLYVSVTDSVADNNGIGIHALSGDAAAGFLVVARSTIANNETGLLADGINGYILLTQSTVTGNTTNGWSTLNSGRVYSAVDNTIESNAGNEAAPPSYAKK
jgi:Right handed beta helix region